MFEVVYAQRTLKYLNRVELLLTGVPLPVAMSIRKIMMNDFACFAIDKVDIVKNDSLVCSNNHIIQSLCLIPLVSSASQKCSVSSEIRIDLNVCADEKDTRTVYSKDLQIRSTEISLAYDDIFIAKLQKKGKLQLTAIAKKGTGDMHMKYRPVTAPVIIEKGENILFKIEAISMTDPLEYFIAALMRLEEEEHQQEIENLILSMRTMQKTTQKKLEVLRQIKH